MFASGVSLWYFGTILAGYSSASKWSLFGAMREAAQVVSYEVPLALATIHPLADAARDRPCRPAERGTDAV